MKIIHTLWSRPLLLERWKIKNQFVKSHGLFKLSFLYAKRLGYEVVLHTDTDGFELLGNIGYDRIEISLNDLPKDESRFWAISKIRALQLEGLNGVHIDGDVFLKSDNIKELLESDYSVLTQMIESRNSFIKQYRPQIDLVHSVSNLLESPVNHSFNCGILRIKDIQLFEAYTDLVKELISLFKNNKKIEDYYQNEFRFFEPTLIVEQYALAVITERLKMHPKFIINKEDDSNEACKYYGFVHAMGKIKYQESFQKKVNKRIKEVENDLLSNV